MPRRTSDPYIIVPKNADVRIRGFSDSASGRQISCEIQGILLGVSQQMLLVTRQL